MKRKIEEGLEKEFKDMGYECFEEQFFSKSARLGQHRDIKNIKNSLLRNHIELMVEMETENYGKNSSYWEFEISRKLDEIRKRKKEESKPKSFISRLHRLENETTRRRIREKEKIEEWLKKTK